VLVACSAFVLQEEVCLLAATQTDAASMHAGSSSAKASAAAAALAEGTSASAPESSLQVQSSRQGWNRFVSALQLAPFFVQVTAMACLQRAFLRLPAHPVQQRATLLRELATAHIRSTGGRRYRRVFGVPLSVPRPHLVPRGSSSDASAAASASAAAGAGPEDGGRSMVHVTACTALVCLLLQVS
jgi:hypothetical protein